MNCPHCGRTIKLDVSAAAGRVGAASEHGGQVLSVFTSRDCPECQAGLRVTIDGRGVTLEVAHVPYHPRWSARGLAWSPGSGELAVASVEGRGVTVVRRRGLDVSLGAELARCEHYGFDPSGERLLVDFTPFPRLHDRDRRFAVWSVARGDVVHLAKSPVAVRTPFLARVRSATATDAIGFHRGGAHVVAISRSGTDEVLATAWTVDGSRVVTERVAGLAGLAGGRAWLEPGGDRLLWEAQVGPRCTLVLFRVEPTSRGLVSAPLGVFRAGEPMDVCDVAWEEGGSILVAYLRNEKGLVSYDRMPYGLARFDAALGLSLSRFPLEPELCPPPPEPTEPSTASCVFAPRGGDVIFVSDRAYALDATTLVPRAALPTNLVGAEALRVAPAGDVVAIAGPADVHLASLAGPERVSLRATLG